MVLSVPGVDYESLDRSEQEYAVKRLEAALKTFGPGFHVYQYLFKTNRPDIPFANYDDPVVAAAIDQRRNSLRRSATIFLRSRSSTAFCSKARDRRPAWMQHSPTLSRSCRGHRRTESAVHERQHEDAPARPDRARFAPPRTACAGIRTAARGLHAYRGLEPAGTVPFFRRLLNYDDWRIAGRPQYTQFLDYQVVNSNIEAERDHLRVGDHFVRVLTMKEAITETRPLVLDALLKIPANFCVITEWIPLAADKARKEVNKRRKHFNVSKTGFVSQMGNDATKTNPRDVLVDESKQADIENLATACAPWAMDNRWASFR